MGFFSSKRKQKKVTQIETDNDDDLAEYSSTVGNIIGTRPIDNVKSTPNVYTPNVYAPSLDNSNTGARYSATGLDDSNSNTGARYSATGLDNSNSNTGARYSATGLDDSNSNTGARYSATGLNDSNSYTRSYDAGLDDASNPYAESYAPGSSCQNTYRGDGRSSYPLSSEWIRSTSPTSQEQQGYSRNHNFDREDNDRALQGRKQIRKQAASDHRDGIVKPDENSYKDSIRESYYIHSNGDVNAQILNGSYYVSQDEIEHLMKTIEKNNQNWYKNNCAHGKYRR